LEQVLELQNLALRPTVAIARIRKEMNKKCDPVEKIETISNKASS
jgi:hypothetical protein